MVEGRCAEETTVLGNLFLVGSWMVEHILYALLDTIRVQPLPERHLEIVINGLGEISTVSAHHVGKAFNGEVDVAKKLVYFHSFCKIL